MTHCKVSTIGLRSTTSSLKVFVDGNYFIKICGKYESGHERARDLELGTLLGAMLNQSRLLSNRCDLINNHSTVNYYDAAYLEKDALRDPRIAAKRKGAMGFHSMLSKKCGFKVNTDGYMTSSGFDQKWSQKGVDSTIALDIVEAAQDTSAHLVLVGGDGDLLPGVKRALSRGATVTMIAEKDGVSSQFQQLAAEFPSFELVLLSRCDLDALCDVSGRFNRAA